ncbi:hypothetical protein Pla52n_10500 [Stieleria varia]|uniref:Uncharacterized protein n=1 Tax=Stieleria varia TaxID=2528005 RepID=A0A5C6B9R6_9BACT|nr:hypothetical protein Pla52n_10500 [Stieleria varia]
MYSTDTSALVAMQPGWSSGFHMTGSSGIAVLLENKNSSTNSSKVQNGKEEGTRERLSQG